MPDVLALSEEELGELLGVAASRLAAAGVAVHWPRDLARDLTATAVVRPAPGSATDGTGFFESEDLLRFRWQTRARRRSAQRGRDGHPSPRPTALSYGSRDRWVLVDPALVRKARKRELGLLDPVDALSVALTGTAEVDGETVEAVPDGALATLRDRLTAGPRPATPPPGLNATLRDYQLRGLAWLDLMTSLGLGGCLADDPGLGKTVTLIAPAPEACPPRSRPSSSRPASLLGNWQREITRFAPGVPVRRFHGPDRTLDDVTGGFVLTTYGTMRSTAARLAEQPWGMVVADEAQHVKNPFSRHRQGAAHHPVPRARRADRHPVENNLSELWALLDWTTPGLLGPLKSFRARHARAVENGEDEEAAQRLAQARPPPSSCAARSPTPGSCPSCRPRRRPTTRCRSPGNRPRCTRRWCASRCWPSRRRRAWHGGGLVLKLLGALKQICDHPALYLKEQPDPDRLAARSGKSRPPGRAARHPARRGRASALVFTQYVGMARPPRRPPVRPRDPRRPAARRHPGARAGAHGEPLPERRDPRPDPLLEGGRHGPQPHPRGPCRPLRPLVEPGGRGTGHRPRVPHRADPARPGPPPGHRGGRWRTASPRCSPPSGRLPTPSSAWRGRPHRTHGP